MSKRVFLAIVLALGLVLALCPTQTARAATPRYVATAGSDAGDCSDSANPCRTISYAIGQAIAGDTINVAAGTYDSSTETFPIDIGKTLFLMGAQANADPRPSQGGRTGGESVIDADETSSAVLRVVTTSGVEINGFTITGGTGDMVEESGHADNLLFRYNILYDDLASAGDEAIQVKYSDGVVMEYNYAYDVKQDALNLSASSNGVVRYNEVHDIHSENAAIYCYDATNIDIIGNLVYDVPNNDGIKLGDSGDGSTGGVVSDNEVHDAAEDGITIYASGVTVENNTIYNCDSENGALYLYGADNSTVTGNEIYNNDAIGLLVHSSSNVTVRENNIHGNDDTNDTKYTGSAGIWLTSEASTMDVADNCITGNADFGVKNEATTVTDAEGNWWGAADGPSGAGSGSGDSVSTNVDYDPWATAPIVGVCAPASPDADITVHAYADYPNPDTGYAGYRVRVYHAGGGYITYKDTDASGDATFTLDNGDYTYTVEKWGATSAPQSFTVAGVDQTLDHHLSVITVHAYADYPAADTGYEGYRARLYLAGGAYMTYRDTDSSGNAYFVVPVPTGDDQFEYTVEKWGAYSEKQSIDVDYCSDKTVDHHLSVVTVHAYANHPAAGTGYKGYRVRLYLADGTYMTYRDTEDSGNAYFVVPVPAGENQFEYNVEKWAAYSEKQSIDVDYCSDTTVDHHLSVITVHAYADYPAAGTGYKGYRVRLYLAGGAYMTYRDTDSSGNAYFVVPVPAGDDQFEYNVERWAAYSEKQSIDVDYCSDKTVDHHLSVITVHAYADYPADNTGYKGYRVRLYLADGTYMTYRDTDDSGNAYFVVPVPAGDDQFKYDVERWKAYSERRSIDVTYCSDTTVDHHLSVVTIHAYTGTSLPGTVQPGARVRLYLADDTYMTYRDTDSNGDARFVVPVPAGSEQFKYTVEKGCHNSQLVAITVTYCQDKLVNHRLVANITIKAGDTDGTGHEGYKVEVYKPGATYPFASQVSGVDGLTTFELDALTDYQYTVRQNVNWTRKSARVDFTTCSDATIEYKLAKIDIRVAGGGSANYKVEIYSQGQTYAFTNQSVPANGTMTAYVVDGDYEYTVRYDANWTRKSERVDFTVAPPSSPADDQSLTFNLAKIDVQVAGNGSASYKVELYAKGQTYAFTSAVVNPGDTMTVYGVDGDYQYTVRYNANWTKRSARVDFTVSRTEAPPVVTCGNRSLTFNLAKIDIQVAGSGSASYKVELYAKGQTYAFTSAVVNPGDTMTVYGVDGDYQYTVRYNANWTKRSARVDFTVGRSESGDTVTCGNESLTFNLAKIDIQVTGGGAASYQVELYAQGQTYAFTSAVVNAGDTMTVYGVDGDYQYTVRYNANWTKKSARVDFTVGCTGSGDIVTCGNESLTYELAEIAIEVVNKRGQGLAGFKVEVYADGQTYAFANQTTPSSGEVVFYLVDGAHEYRVRKDCYDSGRVDFTVTRSISGDVVTAHDQSITHHATVNVTIKVSDGLGVGHKSYLVRVYHAGGSQVAYQWSNSSGMTGFELDAPADYEYLVEKNGAKSQKYPVSGCQSQSLEYKLATVTVKVGDSGGGGHKSYLVRIYNAGSSTRQWGYQWSNSSGMTTFYLIEGDYTYLVEKNGARSAKIAFTVDPPNAPDDQSLEYKLATVTVKVGDSGGGGHKSYLVRIYNAGSSTRQWGYQWSNSSGMTTFYLIEGSYTYLVEKNGARSAKIPFTVADTDHAVPISGNPDDQNLEYKLATVTVKVGDSGGGGHKSYLVRIYNASSSTRQWGYQWSNSSGMTTFYLIEGSYTYLVEKNGARSAKIAFTVADTDHAVPISGNPDDQNLEYKLAMVTVKVGDSSVANSGHKSYLVRIYNAGASQWGYQWSNNSGMTTFYLIEGSYTYLVEKNGARSAKIAFTVADTDHAVPISGTPDDQNLEYKLATVTVKVGDSSVANPGHKSYLVRIYNASSSMQQWGYQWSNSSGMTTFYLIEGSYTYLVEKNGARSAKIAFTVASPLPADDQGLEYKLATVTVHVQDSGGSPLKSYLVRVYNYSAGQWGYQWTNSSGDSVFYLVEGSYQYQVEKNGYNSGKQPAGGFTVAQAGVATHTWTVP